MGDMRVINTIEQEGGEAASRPVEAEAPVSATNSYGCKPSEDLSCSKMSQTSASPANSDHSAEGGQSDSRVRVEDALASPLDVQVQPENVSPAPNNAQYSYEESENDAPHPAKPTHTQKLSSTLDSDDDPFDEREGKTLVWQNVNMTLKGVRGTSDKKILDGVWGEVPRTKLTAVMGPSGSSKTSLLDILSGRVASRGQIRIESDIRLDNFPVNPQKMRVRKQIAVVAQEDSLQITSTPREAIRFSAKLRLPRTTTESQLDTLTNRVLLELGLNSCADTIIGGPLLKGISGGERRRTSVGVELIVKPQIMFLDEPTSGLDSFSAIQLVSVLKKVSHAGASVLVTIHQPSSQIFNAIDHLILLNKGRVMFQGSVPSIPTHFAGYGVEIPPNYNPADWILSVAQSVPIDQLEQKGFFPKDDRIMAEPFTHVEGKDELGITVRKGINGQRKDDSPVRVVCQIRLLFQREVKSLYRNSIAIAVRLGFTVLVSLLIGAIMLGVGAEDRGEPSVLQSQFGALMIVLMCAMVGTSLPALLAFPQERPVFLREYATNHYNVLSYFLSHFTMEFFITGLQVFLLCVITFYMIAFQGSFFVYFMCTYALAMTSTAMAVMLGASIEDPTLAQEMLPVVFIPQMVFAGFFVAPRFIPEWLRWIRYLCSLTYAVRILLVEEFDRDCGGSLGNTFCDYVLEQAEADSNDVWWSWLALGGLFLFFRISALLMLWQKAKKFY